MLAAFFVTLIMAVGLVVNYAVNLVSYADQNLQRTVTLTQQPPTPGTTWLLVGSDIRGRDGFDDHGGDGARSDAVLLLHQADNGQTSLISIPRLAWVNVPGFGYSPLNNAFDWGGPGLLIDIVQKETGLTIDRYVETGLGGLAGVVDALGGVELCLDYDVDDYGKSYLQWEAGCHVVDGQTTIAFARMRYSDPLDDEGRSARHRQILSALTTQVTQPEFLTNPQQHLALVRQGVGAFRVDDQLEVPHLVDLALALAAATGPNGVTGAPPTVPAEVQMGIMPLVEFDPSYIEQYWENLRNGSL